MNIKINKLLWEVKAVPLYHEDLKLENGNDCIGLTSYTKLTIHIAIVDNRELFRSTVIHELVHAFAFSFGVHLLANEETEESICDFVGSYLDDIYSTTNRIMEGVYEKCLKQKKS